MIDEVVSEIQRRKEKLLEYIDSPAFSEKSKNRLKIQDACSRSEEAKIFALSACSKDPVFFINNFAWIFAAKSELQIDNDPNFPFILFDFQEDATYKIKESIDFGKDLIIEKSRDMGVSWLIIWMIIWFWLFDESFTGHLGSLTEDLVDNGTIDSLFGKIDYCLRNLPKWMLPARFNIKKHRQSMKLTNPETFSLITGQAPTQHFGRGPRKKAIFFDELPAWEYGKQAWDACFSDDTETLTKEGWKLIKDVTTDDLVYSMDDNFKARYMPVTIVHKRHYDSLINFTNKSVDLMVSEDHNMMIENRGGRYWGMTKAKEIFDGKFSTYGIPLVSDWQGEHKEKIYGFDAGDWMEFLGWYVSGGWMPRISNTVCIAQSNTANPNKVKEIKELLDRMKVKYSYNGSKDFYISSSSIPNKALRELRSLGICYYKHIPRHYLGLESSLIKRLYESLIKGDGSVHERRGRIVKVAYTTSSKQLADDFQEICQKIGLRGRIHKKSAEYNFIHASDLIRSNGLTIDNMHDKYCVNVCFKGKANLDKMGMEIVEYGRDAYCVTTPFHSLYVRRNNIASWCGNCADTTSSRIGLGTSMGANFFKALRDGLLGEIDVLTLHWRLHPLKDDKWYEFEKSRRDEETIARELDISYEGSQVGRVYPEWIRNIEWIESEPDDKLPIYTFWDLGQSDNTAIIWFQGSMYNPIIIDAYTNFNKGADFYIPFITGMLDENDPRYNEQDKEIIMSHRRWRFPEKNIVGPDANFIHQSSNQSISDVFKSSGIRLHYETGSKDFLPRKESMKIFLKNKIKVRKNPRTEYLSMCIDNAHYPNIQRGGMQETKSVLPVHDYTEAYRSAMEYGVFFITRRKDSKNSMVSDKFKKGNPFISRFSKR